MSGRHGRGSISRQKIEIIQVELIFAQTAEQWIVSVERTILLAWFCYHSFLASTRAFSVQLVSKVR
jgi:hypothetical protein